MEASSAKTLMSGYVYTIRNKVPGHRRFGWRYVGKAGNLHRLIRRIQAHIRNSHNRLLRNDIRKYGIENFGFRVIPTKADEATTFAYEVEFIKEYDCTYPNGYNFSTGGEGWSLSAEALERRSASRSGKPSWNKGIPRSVTHPNAKPRKGRLCSVETRRKLSEANKARYERRKREHLVEGMIASQG